MQLWVIHKAKQHACTCLDCCFIFPSAMRAFWNACLTEIDPVVPTHCCSLLSIPQLPPAPSPSLSFSSSVAELERCLASLVLSSLITYLHSFSLHQHQMKEGAPRPPSFPHLLSLLVFVCFMSAVAGESWGVLYWEIQLSLPALILDNRKRARYSQFNYWQCWMQRCMCMSVLRRVSTCRPKQARKCTLDLFNYAFSFKACIFRLMIVLLSCSGCCLSFSLSPFFSAGTSVSRRPSSSL